VHLHHFIHKLVHCLIEHEMLTEIEGILTQKLKHFFESFYAFPNAYDFLEDLTCDFVFHRGNKIIWCGNEMEVSLNFWVFLIF